MFYENDLIISKIIINIAISPMETIIERTICTLYFYLDRCSNEKHEQIYVYIDNLIQLIVKNNMYSYLHTLYKLLHQTRDCLYGKGERDITYVFICAFYKYYPNQTMYAFHHMCLYFGCWADIKYFCRFVKDFKLIDEKMKQKLTYSAIDILIQQFDLDFYNWEHHFHQYLQKTERNPRDRPYAPDIISFVAKWIPRESNSFGWLYEKIVERYHHIHAPYIQESLESVKSIFRKKVSRLSRELRTDQIFMCEKKFDQVVPSKMTLQTMLRQSKSLTTYKNEPSFDECCESFYNYIDSDEKNDNFKKSLNISMGTLVKKGFRLLREKYNNSTEYQMKMLNNIWNKIVRNTTFSLSVIPVVDMSGEQKYNSIGLAILLAQVSTYKKIIVAENDFDVIALNEECFIDILRKFMDYKAIFFNLREMFSCLYQKHNEMYVDQLYYVVLSSELNILKNYDLENMYDKQVRIVFWNVFSNSDSLTNLPIDNHFYLSGTSSKLIHFFKNVKDTPYEQLTNYLSHYDFTNHIVF